VLDRDQANYLFAVMRLQVGDAILVFNGRDGEWRCEVREASKRQGVLEAVAMTRPLRPAPDLWLLFAPIKRARLDVTVEKAVELGVARLQPVQTEFTNSERIRPEKMAAHIIEAAEQCGATHLPELGDLVPLSRLLADWPADRQILWCDEGEADQPPGSPTAGDAPAARASAIARLQAMPRGPWAIIIGPEGGFSPTERERLKDLPFVHRIGLGPRILRAETAAIAAITLWQATLGDWQD